MRMALLVAVATFCLMGAAPAHNMAPKTLAPKALAPKTLARITYPA